MTPATPALELIVRLDGTRVHVGAAPLGTAEPHTGPTLGTPAQFLLDLRDRRADRAGRVGTVPRGVLGVFTVRDAPPRTTAARMLVRSPSLRLDLLVDPGMTLAVPAGLDAVRALWLPLLADAALAMERCPLRPGATVAIDAEFVPESFGRAVVAASGHVPVSFGQDAPGVDRPSACLLFRPGPEILRAAVAAVADRGFVFVVDPDFGEIRFDFYTDVHRRGLHLMHATWTGGPIPSAALAALEPGGADSGSQPTVAVRVPEILRRETIANLPERPPVFLLRVDP